MKNILLNTRKSVCQSNPLQNMFGVQKKELSSKFRDVQLLCVLNTKQLAGLTCTM